MRFKNERTWLDLVNRWARFYGVPPWVVNATIATESSFDPGAFAGPGDGRGLMQLTEGTARGLGYTGALGDDARRKGGLYDPETSIALGTKLLGSLRRRFPREPWDRIYSAYNSGSPTGAPAKHVASWRRHADYFRPGWAFESGAAPLLIAGILSVVVWSLTRRN